MLAAQPARGRVRAEIAIVLGLSLGLSAVYSVLSFVNAATRERSLAQQRTTLNSRLDERQLFDLVYQLVGILADLVPVALVVWLLWSGVRPRLGRLGLDGRRSARDTGWGVALALVIGVPGLGLYAVGRALGLSVYVEPTALADYWWTVPVLLLSAARAGITEEVIVVGYLFARLRDLGWRPWTVIVSTALLRGIYHLYQGSPAFVGNVAMGLLFGWLYHRFGRLLPLVVAHFLIDAAVFVGYPVVAAAFPELFTPPA